MNLKNLKLGDKLQRAAGLTAGGVAHSLISTKLVPMIMPNADAKATNGIAMAVGLFAPDFLKKSRSSKPGMIDAVADGITTIAGLNLASSFFPGMIGYLTDPYSLSGFLTGPDGGRYWGNYNAGLVAENSLTGVGQPFENSPGAPVTGMAMRGTY